MSTGEHKQLISGLVDEVWNQHNAAAIDRYFGPGLREEVADHYQQLLGGFPDLQVRIEDELIAEGDLVVARLTLTGTQTGPFAGRDASGRLPAGRRFGSTGSPAARSSRPGPCRTASGCCSSSAPSPSSSRSIGRPAGEQVPDQDDRERLR